MLVVSDATPINVLVRGGLVELLAGLYGSVVIPPTVRDELTHPKTPAVVREWLAKGPVWLEVRAPTSAIAFGPRGKGEREAIALAKELGADLLLADDRAARNAAATLGIRTTGTLGILLIASERKLVPLSQSLSMLPEDYRLSDSLRQAALELDARCPGDQHGV